MCLLFLSRWKGGWQKATKNIKEEKAQCLLFRESKELWMSENRKNRYKSSEESTVKRRVLSTTSCSREDGELWPSRLTRHHQHSTPPSPSSVQYIFITISTYFHHHCHYTYITTTNTPHLLQHHQHATSPFTITKTLQYLPLSSSTTTTAPSTTPLP